MLKPLTVWITTNCGKFLKRWEYQTTLPASWEMFTQVKKQQLELDMEQWTGSKLGKEYIKAVYCHPASLTYMQSTSCEMPGWMKHKLESRFPGEISITLDTQMIPDLWQKVKRNKIVSWWKWKRRVKKTGLKLNIQKTKIMASGPVISVQTDGEAMETVTNFVLGGLQNHCRWWLRPWNQKTFAPCKKSYDQVRQHFKKQSHYSVNKSPSSQGYDFSSSHVWRWELDHKESWELKNWCFLTVVLKKPLEGPLDSKEIQPMHPKEN